MHSEIQQRKLDQETDKDFQTFKYTCCYAVASTITTAPTDPLHCYEVISTIALKDPSGAGYTASAKQTAKIALFFLITQYSYLDYLAYDERPHLHVGYTTPEPVSAPLLIYAMRLQEKGQYSSTK